MSGEHRLEVVSKFIYDGYVCKCSCGWQSEEMVDQDSALALGREHTSLPALLAARERENAALRVEIGKAARSFLDLRIALELLDKPTMAAACGVAEESCRTALAAGGFPVDEPEGARSETSSETRGGET